jgi:hypothetical protein
LTWALARASGDNGDVMVSQKRTNNASASVDRPLLLSRRWTWRPDRDGERRRLPPIGAVGREKGYDGRFHDRRSGGEIIDLSDHLDGKREVEAVTHSLLLQVQAISRIRGAAYPHNSAPSRHELVDGPTP